MNAFCAPVNFDAFIVLSSSPSQGRVAENSSFKRSSFQGAEQLIVFGFGCGKRAGHGAIK
jgi:hypothetical protein